MHEQRENGVVSALTAATDSGSPAFPFHLDQRPPVPRSQVARAHLCQRRSGPLAGRGADSPGGSFKPRGRGHPEFPSWWV